MQRQIRSQTHDSAKQQIFGVQGVHQRVKIKNAGRYVYQCGRYKTTFAPQTVFLTLYVVAMCTSQAVFWLLGGRYVYTFIIYHGSLSTNDRRERANASKRSSVGA